MTTSELSIALVVGVVASLLAVFISVVLSSIWRNIVTPWFEERQYKGPEISGAWKTKVIYEDNEKNENIYYLNRSAHKITGYIYCVDGIDKGSSWYIEGEFNNLILTLVYRSKNKCKLDRGSITLMLVNNGEILQGHISYYQDLGHSIESVPMELSPIKDDGHAKKG